MSDLTTGWRKRQIALDIKAENAHELGLDYEPSKTIEMAREAGFSSHHNPDLYDCLVASYEAIERFAELVREDEAEKYKWDIHSCGPTCKRYACVAMREAVLAEREACIVDIQMHIPRSGRHTPEYQMAMRMIERIRARGQA
jgi:hypothetical protein